MSKYTINLLQPELIVKPAFLTLAKVVGLWALLALAMIAWYVLNSYQFTNYSDHATRISLDNDAKKTQLNELEKAIKERKLDPRLQEQVATLNLVLENKQALRAHLTDSSQLSVAGFAEAMTELSNNHHRDVSLTRVLIQGQQMLFSGLAKNPNAVPVWLAGFEHSALLSGQRFSKMSLAENEQGYIDFSVSSVDQLVTDSEGE